MDSFQMAAGEEYEVFIELDYKGRQM